MLQAIKKLLGGLALWAKIPIYPPAIFALYQVVTSINKLPWLGACGLLFTYL